MVWGDVVFSILTVTSLILEQSLGELTPNYRTSVKPLGCRDDGQQKPWMSWNIRSGFILVGGIQAVWTLDR
jgi:hypothetical protein